VGRRCFSTAQLGGWQVEDWYRKSRLSGTRAINIAQIHPFISVHPLIYPENLGSCKQWEDKSSLDQAGWENQQRSSTRPLAQQLIQPVKHFWG
jgi:hypothetical protein